MFSDAPVIERLSLLRTEVDRADAARHDPHR